MYIGRRIVNALQLLEYPMSVAEYDALPVDVRPHPSMAR
jgi:hypothetical protein